MQLASCGFGISNIIVFIETNYSRKAALGVFDRVQLSSRRVFERSNTRFCRNFVAHCVWLIYI